MDEKIDEQGAHGGEESAVHNNGENLNLSLLTIPDETEFEENIPPRSTSINKSQKPASALPEQPEKRSLWSRATAFGRLKRRSRSAEALEREKDRGAEEENLDKLNREIDSETIKPHWEKSGDIRVEWSQEQGQYIRIPDPDPEEDILNLTPKGQQFLDGNFQFAPSKKAIENNCQQKYTGAVKKTILNNQRTPKHSEEFELTRGSLAWDSLYLPQEKVVRFRQIDSFINNKTPELSASFKEWNEYRKRFDRDNWLNSKSKSPLDNNFLGDSREGASNHKIPSITIQPPTPVKGKETQEAPQFDEESFMSDASRNRSNASSGFGEEVPRRTHDRIMDNTFQFQRMIRSAIAALPTATNSKPQFLKFLVCADSEYASFRNVLHSSAMMMRVFVKGLLSKLDEPLFSIVSNSVPEDYSEFRRTLIRGTSFVRPRQVIETEARSMMQLPGESTLQYFYKVENLLTEYRIAAEMEEIPHAAKSAMYDMFQKELLKWLPNGLASPLNHIAKYQVFESFQEFKEFLQKEKERG